MIRLSRRRGEARLRVGVGAHQEVGVSAFGGAGSKDPVDGAIGGKLAYKVSPVPWFAVVANGGAYDFIGGSTGINGGLTHTAVFGGDLATVFAAHLDERGTQLYGGARGSFAIPVMTAAHGATEALTVPAGAMLKLSDRVRFFMEAGFVALWAQYRDETSPTYDADFTLLGGYGAAGVQFIVR